jgi:hypothetical protein
MSNLQRFGEIANSRKAEADRFLEQGNKPYESAQFESALSFVYEFSDLLDDGKGQDFSLFGGSCL